MIKFVDLICQEVILETNSRPPEPDDMALLCVQNGVAGSFWYSTAAVINMILFPVLSVQFKTRAPGAKTFLQVSNPLLANLLESIEVSSTM